MMHVVVVVKNVGCTTDEMAEEATDISEVPAVVQLSTITTDVVVIELVAIVVLVVAKYP